MRPILLLTAILLAPPSAAAPVVPATAPAAVSAAAPADTATAAAAVAAMRVALDRSGRLVPSPEILAEAVREPLFAFALAMIDADSLGTWTADDLADFAVRYGQETDFPLEHIASLAREAVPEDQVMRHGGRVSSRRFVIRLREDRLEMAMPYSILGYHPGSLVFASPLVLNEWRLGRRGVMIREEDGTRRVRADALTILQLEQGFMVLDVDGWLDRLLGKSADDAWILGFGLAWIEDELVGIGCSVGRNGRRIYGELNFRTGEIEGHGRPVARGLSSYSRTWMQNVGGGANEPWAAY